MGGCKRCEQTGGRKHISVLDANNVLLCAPMAVQLVHGMVILSYDERWLDGSFASLVGYLSLSLTDRITLEKN